MYALPWYYDVVPMAFGYMVDWWACIRVGESGNRLFGFFSIGQIRKKKNGVTHTQGGSLAATTEKAFHC